MPRIRTCFSPRLQGGPDPQLAGPPGLCKAPARFITELAFFTLATEGPTFFCAEIGAIAMPVIVRRGGRGNESGECASVGSDHSTGEAMTYSSGGPGYPGAPQSGAYAQTTQFAKVDEGPSKLPGYLLAGVPILGLAIYLLSFGPVWKSGGPASGVTSLGIIAVLFASLFAVVALLPKQGNYTPVVTATAVVGFLLMIWDLIKGADAAGW